jgi:hypothetical protein
VKQLKAKNITAE